MNSYIYRRWLSLAIVHINNCIKSPVSQFTVYQCKGLVSSTTMSSTWESPILSVWQSDSGDGGRSVLLPLQFSSLSHSSWELCLPAWSPLDWQVLRHRHLSRDPPVPSFLYFTLRFWNQILTCFSERLRYVAISMRLSRERYMLCANSLSSSRSCVLVNAVRIRLPPSESVSLLKLPPTIIETAYHG